MVLAFGMSVVVARVSGFVCVFFMFKFGNQFVQAAFAARTFSLNNQFVQLGVVLVVFGCGMAFAILVFMARVFALVIGFAIIMCALNMALLVAVSLGGIEDSRTTLYD